MPLYQTNPFTRLEVGIPNNSDTDTQTDNEYDVQFNHSPSATHPAVYVYQDSSSAEASATINSVTVLANMETIADAQEVIAEDWSDPITVNWSCGDSRWIIAITESEGVDASGTNFNDNGNSGTITVSNWDGTTDPIYLKITTRNDS